MRALAPALAAALLGAVLGATLARAGEPAIVGPAVCTPLPVGTGDKVAPRAQDAVNEHLKAGRTHFLDAPAGGFAICAW